MKARGEAVRPDDNPETLEKRVHAYRVQTAPLVSYYRDHGTLRSVDGMAPIHEVSAAIDQLLGSRTAPEPGPQPAQARRKVARKRGVPTRTPRRAAKAAARQNPRQRRAPRGENAAAPPR